MVQARSNLKSWGRARTVTIMVQARRRTAVTVTVPVTAGPPWPQSPSAVTGRTSDDAEPFPLRTVFKGPGSLITKELSELEFKLPERLGKSCSMRPAAGAPAVVGITSTILCLNVRTSAA